MTRSESNILGLTTTSLVKNSGIVTMHDYFSLEQMYIFNNNHTYEMTAKASSVLFMVIKFEQITCDKCYIDKVEH